MTAPTTRETADHAELARRLRVSWSDRGWVASNKIKELLGEAREAADALEALLSEIAALRGEVERLASINVDHCSAVNTYVISNARLDDRLTQAERQRDELRKALERLASSEAFETPRVIDGPLAPEMRARMSYARQVLANQGADQ